MNTDEISIATDPLRSINIAALNRKLISQYFIWLVVIAGFAAGFVLPGGMAGALVLGIALAIWIWSNSSTTRSAEYLRRAGIALAAGDQDSASTILALSFRTFNLSRKSVLRAYLLLAMLRVQQQDYFEASQICRILLRKSGRNSAVKTKALLMEAECRLKLDDIEGTYKALSAVQNRPANLMDTLQIESIRIAYEAHVGETEKLLQNLPHRISLIRMMLPQKGGESLVHLAEAAQLKGEFKTAALMKRHAELLGTQA